MHSEDEDTGVKATQYAGIKLLLIDLRINLPFRTLGSRWASPFRKEIMKTPGGSGSTVVNGSGSNGGVVHGRGSGSNGRVVNGRDVVYLIWQQFDSLLEEAVIKHSYAGTQLLLEYEISLSTVVVNGSTMYKKKCTVRIF